MLIFLAIYTVLEAVVVGAVCGALLNMTMAAMTGGDIGEAAATGAITGGLFGFCHVVADGVVIAHMIVGGSSSAINANITGGDPYIAAVVGGLSAGASCAVGNSLTAVSASFSEALVIRSTVGFYTGFAVSGMMGGDPIAGGLQGAWTSAYGMLFNCSLDTIIDIVGIGVAIYCATEDGWAPVGVAVGFALIPGAINLGASKKIFGFIKGGVSKKGPTAFRQGTFADEAKDWGGNCVKGKQWAADNPLTTKGYAKKYGLPAENTGKPDWVVKRRVEGNYTTRPAPASHNNPANTGGGTEIIPGNSNDVRLEWFHMPD